MLFRSAAVKFADFDASCPRCGAVQFRIIREGVQK
jgi:hypothetical protein